MTEYALESKGLPMWHAVKVASHTSNEVVGLCGHRFPITRQPTSERPSDDSLCAGCKHQESLRGTAPGADLARNQDEARSTRAPATNSIFTGSTPKKE